jgi:hypothetical protein
LLSFKSSADDRVTKGIRQENLLDVPDPVSIGQRPSCFFAATTLRASQPAEVGANFSDSGILVSLFTGYFFFKPGSRNAKAPAAFFTAAHRRRLFRALEFWDHPMIVEVTFWIAVVAATRKLGKAYARSGDVLYGPYLSR